MRAPLLASLAAAPAPALDPARPVFGVERYWLAAEAVARPS